LTAAACNTRLIDLDNRCNRELLPVHKAARTQLKSGGVRTWEAPEMTWTLLTLTCGTFARLQDLNHCERVCHRFSAD